jgi:hypothetical protein
MVNNSRLHTELGSVSFLSRAKIVYQGVAETGMKQTHSYQGFYTILFGIITFLANKQLI